MILSQSVFLPAIYSVVMTSLAVLVPSHYWEEIALFSDRGFGRPGDAVPSEIGFPGVRWRVRRDPPSDKPEGATHCARQTVSRRARGIMDAVAGRYAIRIRPGKEIGRAHVSTPL